MESLRQGRTNAKAKFHLLPSRREQVRAGKQGAPADPRKRLRFHPYMFWLSVHNVPRSGQKRKHIAGTTICFSVRPEWVYRKVPTAPAKRHISSKASKAEPCISSKIHCREINQFTRLPGVGMLARCRRHRSLAYRMAVRPYIEFAKGKHIDINLSQDKSVNTPACSEWACLPGGDAVQEQIGNIPTQSEWV